MFSNVSLWVAPMVLTLDLSGGVQFIGTAGMLFHAFAKKHLTLAELEDAVETLSQTIWLAPAVVVEILKKAREGER